MHFDVTQSLAFLVHVQQTAPRMLRTLAHQLVGVAFTKIETILRVGTAAATCSSSQEDAATLAPNTSYSLHHGL